MRRIIIAILFLSTIEAFAETLSLEEAISMTLKTHPDAEIASMRSLSAAEEVKISQASLYPRIDANGEYFPTKTFVMPANGTFSTRQSNAFHADVSGSYPLWDAGRSANRHQSSLFAKEEAGFEQIAMQNSLIEQVWDRYYEIAYLQSIIDTAEHSVRFYGEQYAQAVKMREAGFKTVADESRFLASKTEAQDRLARAHGEKEKALVALGMLIGRDGFSIDAADFDLRIKRAQGCDMDPAEALRRELGLNNPQLKALRSAIDRQKALWEATHAERYGTLSLVASLGYDNSLSSYDSSQIGIKGSIPLAEGGKLSADDQKSKIALSISQKAYESAERMLWQELFGALSDFKRSDATIAAKAAVIESTQRALNLVQGRYAQGLSTYIDVLESQSILESARVGYNEARYTKLRAWGHIQRLLNKGCFKDDCKN